MTVQAYRPRRSALFMPGNNLRALAKARQLDTDCLLLDLEDAVAPAAKTDARHQLRENLRQGGFGHREVLVRINTWGSPWAEEDLRCFAEEDIDGILLPKVESAEAIEQVAERVEDWRGSPLPIWVMIETPKGILNLDAICRAHPSLSALVMGTADLAKDLRVPSDIGRQNLLFALSQCVLYARAHHLVILDGVYTRFKDNEGLTQQCQQGHDLGFDGKTLIHPNQIEICNQVFAPSSEAISHATRVVEAWSQAQETQGLCVLDGQMVERLHLQEAQQLLALQKQIQSRQDNVS